MWAIRYKKLVKSLSSEFIMFSNANSAGELLSIVHRGSVMWILIRLWSIILDSCQLYTIFTYYKKKNWADTKQIFSEKYRYLTGITSLKDAWYYVINLKNIDHLANFLKWLFILAQSLSKNFCLSCPITSTENEVSLKN